MTVIRLLIAFPFPSFAEQVFPQGIFRQNPSDKFTLCRQFQSLGKLAGQTEDPMLPDISIRLVKVLVAGRRKGKLLLNPVQTGMD